MANAGAWSPKPWPELAGAALEVKGAGVAVVGVKYVLRSSPSGKRTTRCDEGVCVPDGGVSSWLPPPSDADAMRTREAFRL